MIYKLLPFRKIYLKFLVFIQKVLDSNLGRFTEYRDRLRFCIQYPQENANTIPQHRLLQSPVNIYQLTTHNHLPISIDAKQNTQLKHRCRIILESTNLSSVNSSNVMISKSKLNNQVWSPKHVESMFLRNSRVYRQGHTALQPRMPTSTTPLKSHKGIILQWTYIQYFLWDTHISSISITVATQNKNRPQIKHCLRKTRNAVILWRAAAGWNQVARYCLSAAMNIHAKTIQSHTERF
jgi:hypothetical protein